MPIYDNQGFPKDHGATDFEDSARLAGLLTTFKINARIYLTSYIKNNKYVRHPNGSIYSFSRDQATAFVAGLYTMGLSNLVDKKMIDGKDLWSPSQMGHLKICAGLKPNWLQENWFWLDVLYSCFYNPMAESNQLLCMMMVRDKKYLKFWCKHNKYWRKSISEYWFEGKGEWRGERELAEQMIEEIEELIK